MGENRKGGGLAGEKRGERQEVGLGEAEVGWGGPEVGVEWSKKQGVGQEMGLGKPEVGTQEL